MPEMEPRQYVVLLYKYLLFRKGIFKAPGELYYHRLILILFKGLPVVLIPLWYLCPVIVVMTMGQKLLHGRAYV